MVVVIGDCRDLTATNGVRTTKVYGELTRFLMDRVGYNDGFDPAALDDQPTPAGALAACQRGLPRERIDAATAAVVGEMRAHRRNGVRPAENAWPGIDAAANGAWCWVKVAQTIEGPDWNVYAVGPDGTPCRSAPSRAFASRGWPAPAGHLPEYVSSRARGCGVVACRDSAQTDGVQRFRVVFFVNSPT